MASGVEVFPCKWCLVVPGRLVLTRGMRCRRLRVGPRRLVLTQDRSVADPQKRLTVSESQLADSVVEVI